MIKYKNYKIPVPVQKSNGQNDVGVSTRQHQNPTATRNMNDPERLNVRVSAGVDGKISLGSLYIFDPLTSELDDVDFFTPDKGASGKSHCPSAPQLCNSSFIGF